MYLQNINSTRKTKTQVNFPNLDSIKAAQKDLCSQNSNLSKLSQTQRKSFDWILNIHTGQLYEFESEFPIQKVNETRRLKL